jgi:hypothetical protein
MKELAKMTGAFLSGSLEDILITWLVGFLCHKEVISVSHIF